MPSPNMAAAPQCSRRALKPAVGDPDAPALLPLSKRAPRSLAFPMSVKAEEGECSPDVGVGALRVEGRGRGASPDVASLREPPRPFASGERSGRSQHGGAGPGPAVTGRPRLPPGRPRGAPERSGGRAGGHGGGAVREASAVPVGEGTGRSLAQRGRYRAGEAPGDGDVGRPVVPLPAEPLSAVPGVTTHSPGGFNEPGAPGREEPSGGSPVPGV